jgi:hypothetical protein
LARCLSCCLGGAPGPISNSAVAGLSGRCVRAEQKRIVLLLLRLLLLRLLLLRLSGRQNARGVLGLLRVGNPQSLLVDGAGRERTSAAERGERSGDL